MGLERENINASQRISEPYSNRAAVFLSVPNQRLKIYSFFFPPSHLSSLLYIHQIIWHPPGSHATQSYSSPEASTSFFLKLSHCLVHKLFPLFF